MKQDYLKWVTKIVAMPYRKALRDGIRKYYDASVPQAEDHEYFTSNWLQSDGTEIDNVWLHEEILQLIDNTIKTECSFGDADVSTTVINAEHSDKKYTKVSIKLPVRKYEEKPAPKKRARKKKDA